MGTDQWFSLKETSRMKFIVSWLAVSFVPLVSGLATLTLPTLANCGDKAVLICTSTDCNKAYKFLRENVPIYNHIGPQNGADPARYSGTITSNSQVRLNINKMELSDAGKYTCNCYYDIYSDAQTLQYQCNPSNASAAVTSSKKLHIAVDRLYPVPSNIVASLTSLTSPLTGTYTCGSSPTLVYHKKCTWESTASLPDGSHGYTMTVTIGTQEALLSGSFRIATPTTPTICNMTTIANNCLRGIQDSPSTIQCVSKGGIPAPTLAWYRGSTSTPPLVQSNSSDVEQLADGSYTVTLKHSFTPSRTDDMTTFLCRLFYPGATNGSSPDPNPASAILYLDLRASDPTVSQIGEAVSGGSMTLRCESTNGRPAPSITWSYRGQTFTPTNNSIHDQLTDTYTVVSLLQRPISAIDNGQLATCNVSHTRLSVSLTGSVNVNVKFGPPTGSMKISGNNATLANGAHQIQLNCTSGSFNPASNITWYNGSNIIPNTGDSTRWFGDYNGVITSNILTITPTRFMDGNRVTCRSDNGYGVDSKPADLDILYSPLIHSFFNITAIEGEPNVTLTCSATSKPSAIFTWYKGTTQLTSGKGTLSNNNSFSYVIPRVNRTSAGSYICHADNNVGSADPKNAYLTVKYPPTVTVITSSAPPIYTVTCNAEGYPDSYTYQDWVQIWPGYGPVATIPFTGTTLNLINVTYEMSGLYVCGASNGVAVYGTGVNFTKGNATLVLDASPVLTDPFPDGTRVPIAGVIGQDATTEIKYWSNVVGSVVRCYKLVDGSRSNFFNCTGTESDAQVKLPVYSHMVLATGTLVSIKIPITSEESLTDYDIVLTNKVRGESVLGISIVAEGHPEAPNITGNFSITPGQVILTVVPGFHGGYNQTIVVQISTDLITWINETSINIGQNRRYIEVALVKLPGNTMFFVRVFGFNTKGRGDEFSAVLNFTTVEDIAEPQEKSSAALTTGIVAGVCVLLVIAVAIFIIYKRRKVGKGKNRSKAGRRGNLDNENVASGIVVECSMYASAGHMQPCTTEGDLYSKPMKTVQATTALYAVPFKPRKGDAKGQNGKLTKGSYKPATQGGESVYEYIEETSSFRPSNPKNTNKDGLIYADLELNNNGKKSVIRGLDDVTTYVQVDFTKAADPLPDSDEEATPEK